ncbi:MAG: MBL fold metallo-hydrolase [Planctomycetes bacterium]|nr:MBL fold metallo-hydrolase [Planctomycetota bacterium]MCH9726424.1 MBL fold metallo-hydrolase [Planctomycetota bacterium]MCH9778233.1 MBL fold metallo-hydrolase [Planctomycetota bacterium]MDF1745758.1 MBL fold metallo-hydrolase [Gimesia sp.]
MQQDSNLFSHRTGEFITLGTGTSVGIPIVGCDCQVCTSPNPKNQRGRTSVYVGAPEGGFLIDTPPELRLQMLREGIPWVHAVLYTHSHADHIFGLDDVRISGYRLEKSIMLHCEEIVEEQIRCSFNYAFETPKHNTHHMARPQLEFQRINTDAFNLLGLKIQPIRLMHGTLPILGFRINDIAFCTDVSEIPKESWKHLEGLDVLILDALRIKPHPTHFNLEQSLKVVERLKPKRTFFTHISHSLEHEEINASLPDNIELAYDGLSVPLNGLSG